MPAVGVNGDGNGEVFRLNLEVGRFMKAYEVDVGGDDLKTTGGGALQGGINTGSVNTGSIAEDSHNLLAFGTSLGTVEFWDARSRNRVGILSAPRDTLEERSEVTVRISRIKQLSATFTNCNVTLGSAIPQVWIGACYWILEWSHSPLRPTISDASTEEGPRLWLPRMVQSHPNSADTHS